MINNIITITYKLKWRIKGNEKYCWSTCKKLFNTKTGKEIKKTIQSSPGYYIDGEFIKLKDIKVELISPC